MVCWNCADGRENCRRRPVGHCCQIGYLSKRWSPKSGGNEVTVRARKSTLNGSTVERPSKHKPVRLRQSASRGASAQPLDRQNTTVVVQAAKQCNLTSSSHLESEHRQTAGQLLNARLGSLRAWQQAVEARCRSLT